MPDEIDFIPRGELATLYRADYDNMLATYIYDRASALSYNEIIQRMEQLREQFRNQLSLK